MTITFSGTTQELESFRTALRQHKVTSCTAKLGEGVVTCILEVGQSGYDLELLTLKYLDK